eukprot:594853-Pleurochrysis_carterae.AAC.13
MWQLGPAGCTKKAGRSSVRSSSCASINAERSAPRCRLRAPSTVGKTEYPRYFGPVSPRADATRFKSCTSVCPGCHSCKYRRCARFVGTSAAPLVRSVTTKSGMLPPLASRHCSIGGLRSRRSKKRVVQTKGTKKQEAGVIFYSDERHKKGRALSGTPRSGLGKRPQNSSAAARLRKARKPFGKLTGSSRRHRSDRLDPSASASRVAAAARWDASAGRAASAASAARSIDEFNEERSSETTPTPARAATTPREAHGQLVVACATRANVHG